MKILFVEDDLSKNIPRLVNLFSDILSEAIINQLKSFGKDDSGYGASPDEIKNIVESSILGELYNSV